MFGITASFQFFDFKILKSYHIVCIINLTLVVFKAIMSITETDNIKLEAYFSSFHKPETKKSRETLSFAFVIRD